MIKTLLIPMIKKYYKLLISILIVQALGCTIMVALSSSHKSLEKTLNNYVEDYHYPDGVITTELTSRDKINNINEKIKIVPRLTFDTIIKHNDKYLSSRVITFGKNDFYKFYEWESNKEEGLYIDYNFANDNEIKIGDKIQFKINDEYREFKVSKIISTPESLSIESSNRFTGFNNDFGYIYVNDEIIIKELNKEYENKKQEVDEKDKELEEKKKQAENEYENLKSSLNYYENIINTESARLQTLKNELDNADNNLNQIKTQLSQLEQSKKQLENAVKELKDNKEKLTEAQKALQLINTTIEELNSKYNQLKDLEDVIELLKTIPSDTKIDRLVKEISFAKAITTKLQEYGIEIDLEGRVWQTADKIEGITNNILLDYEYLNSESTKEYISNLQGKEDTEEYKKLYSTLKKYYPQLNEQNMIDNIPTVYKRIETLKNIIDNSNGLSVIRTVGSLEEVTFKQLIEKVIENQEQLKQYKTVKELIDSYNENLELIQKTLVELKDNKEKIFDQLAALGIKPEEIDKYLQDIDDSIKQIEDNIPKVDEAYNYLLDLYNYINTNKVQYVNTYNTGIAQLTSSKNELYSRKNQLQEEYLNSLKMYNDAKDEIKKAYSTLQDKYNYNNYCNEFLLEFDSDKSNEILKGVEKDLGVEIKNSFTYEESNVKERIDVNLQPIETMSTFMPIVFFVIIMIVIFLFMSLLIKQCRKEIGILRALGFSKLKIRAFFCTIITILSLLAIVLGTVISAVIIRYVGTTYKNFFPLPTMSYILNSKMFIVAIITTIIVSIISTLISTISIDSIKPAEAMSREVPDNRKNIKIINNLKISPFSKFSIISLLRNKIKFIFSCICISACVMMIFAALSFISSKNYILDELYNKRINYDAQIYFKDELDENIIEELNKLDYVIDAQNLSYFDINISTNDKSKQAIINGIDPNTKLVNIYNKDQIEMPKKGIVLEKHLANYLDVKKGDSVTIEGKQYEITEISNQSLNRINYMPNTEASKLEHSQISSIILNLKDNKSEELLEYLSNKDNYLYTIFTERSHNTLLKTFKTYDVAAWILIGFAIIIGFVIILNTSLTNLLEQKKKLSLIKALGQQYSQISRNWFIQSIIQYIIALLIGLPVGVQIAKISLQKLSTENREYMFVNNIEMYLITAILVFIYIVVSHMISMKTLRNWNISESIKERE